MDNLSSHKRVGVRESIELAGASLVYLPPYSPDLNPMELAFSKLNAKLSQAAARTVSDLENAIAQICDQFTPQECKAYLRHCGYSAHSLEKRSSECLIVGAEASGGREACS